MKMANQAEGIGGAYSMSIRKAFIRKFEVSGQLAITGKTKNRCEKN
jgi:hypothetical protein